MLSVTTPLCMQVPIYPPQQSLNDFTPEVCQRIVRESLGLPSIPVRLGTVRQWTMSSQVANQFQVILREICGIPILYLAVQGTCNHMRPTAARTCGLQMIASTLNTCVAQGRMQSSLTLCVPAAVRPWEAS